MTTIGPNTRIDGRIEGDADVSVEGRVDGTISLGETLTVAAGGYVSGDVEARIVVIEGAVSGTVRAEELVHLADGAQVSAEIFANAIRLDSGARLKGRVEMDVEAAPPIPESPTPGTTRTTSSSGSSTSAPRERTSSSDEEPAATTSNSGGNGVDIDPDELTVKELREMLQDRDLPVSGTKSELVSRLRQGG